MSKPFFLEGIRVLIKPLQETFSTSIPNLEELRVRWVSSQSDFLPFTLSAAGLPNLRRLTISCMVLTESSMDLPPNLEYIRLDRCLTQPDQWPPLKLPNLHSIILEDSPWVAEFTLRTLLDASGRALRYLHIGGCCDILIDMVLEALIQTTASKELRELGLAYVDGFADPHVFTILSNMPELRVLHIPCSDVTDCAIKAIAEARLASLKNLGSFQQQRMPNIEQVDIRGCENLSSDAVDYGRTQGIEIIE